MTLLAWILWALAICPAVYCSRPHAVHYTWAGCRFCCPWAAIPNTSKQPQLAICRSRSGLRNVDRPHGVVGGTPAPLPLRPLDELDETVPCEENIDKLVAARA